MPLWLGIVLWLPCVCSQAALIYLRHCDSHCEYLEMSPSFHTTAMQFYRYDLYWLLHPILIMTTNCPRKKTWPFFLTADEISYKTIILHSVVIQPGSGWSCYCLWIMQDYMPYIEPLWRHFVTVEVALGDLLLGNLITLLPPPEPWPHCIVPSS